MDNIIPSAKPGRVLSSSKDTHNTSNLQALGAKTQHSSEVEAMVVEIRPTGDVILATPKGLIRTSTDIVLSPKEKVIARLTNTEESEEITATILSKVENITHEHKTDAGAISKLSKYINNIFSVNPTAENLEESTSDPIKATINYLIPNRHILTLGNKKPGDEISIRVLSSGSRQHGADIMSGEVVGNDGKLLTVNTSMGIITISSKSNFLEGKKILFKVLDIPNKENVAQLKDSLKNFTELVSTNIELLRSIFEDIQDMDNESNYQALLNTKHDNATLAKLFYQARVVPETDVERWIKEEMVEPFEASNKVNKLSFLSEEMTKIGKQLEELGISPAAVWHNIPILIPGTKERAMLKIKKEGKKGIINFTVEIDHAELGKIIVQGLVEMPNEDRHLINLNLNIKYSEYFPETLSNMLTETFAGQKEYAGMDGALTFEKL